MGLAEGTAVDLGLLGPATVKRVIGSGGEGTVYEVARAGLNLAMKWYHPDKVTEEKRAALTALVERGAPHPRFLWPLSMAQVAAAPDGLGYAMPLHAADHLEMGCLVSGKAPDGRELEVNFESVIAICTQLADSFLRLHSEGLCYRDISFGNVLFEPTSGDVQICDNDNVGVDDGTTLVLGTPLFMAPEIVADASMGTRPSTGTDLHSLGVLLFYALCMGHPLEGALSEVGLRNEAWLVRHFGTHPVFCFDPDNDANRPVSGVTSDYWMLYPEFIRTLFVRSFTEGLTDRHARVTEGEWLRALRRLRDSMTSCHQCGVTTFVTDETPTCRGCDVRVRWPLMLLVGRHTLGVNALTEIRTDHLMSTSWVATGPSRLAAVRAHPHDANRWGLQNVSDRIWTASMPDGRDYSVGPDHTIDLAPGMTVDLAGLGLLTVSLPGDETRRAPD